jgi:hypothetical protein
MLSREEFLQSGETFTICLLTPKKFSAAGDIHAVRLTLDETLKNMRNWHDADERKPLLNNYRLAPAGSCERIY